MSNQSGGVRSLDTIRFRQTINAFAGQVRQFEGIVEGINRSVNVLMGDWRGQGASAFERDSRQVQTNLQDIAGIMYDIRDALDKAEAEYMASDAHVSRQISNS